MYRVIIAIVLIVCIGFYWRNRKRLPGWQSLRNRLLFSIKKTDARFIDHLRLFSFSWMVALFLMLALSGFLPALFTGHSLSGLFLILHVFIAPFFLIAFTFWILSTVQRQSFTKDDWSILQKSWKTILTEPQLGIKIIFWITFLLALVGIGTILMSMFALFSAQTIGLLIHVHRYTMLLIFLIAAYTYFIYFSEKQESKTREK